MKLALGVLGVVALGYPLFAASTSPGNRTFPYHGRLDLNGAPLNGAVDVRVALFTSAMDSTACLASSFDSACGVWREEHTAINASSGVFDLILGQLNPVADSVFGSSQLYLGLAVRRSGDPAFSALTGLQKIASVPYAAASTPQTEFRTESMLVSRGVIGKDPSNNLHLDASPDGGIFLGFSPQANVHVGNNNAGAGNAVITSAGAYTGTALAVTGAVTAGGSISSTNGGNNTVITPTSVQIANGARGILLDGTTSTVAVTDGTNTSLLGPTGLNGIGLRIKHGNNGLFPCAVYCNSSNFGGYAAGCIGGKNPSGQFVDCATAVTAIPPGQELTCLCATF